MPCSWTPTCAWSRYGPMGRPSTATSGPKRSVLATCGRFGARHVRAFRCLPRAGPCGACAVRDLSAGSLPGVVDVWGRDLAVGVVDAQLIGLEIGRAHV